MVRSLLAMIFGIPKKQSIFNLFKGRYVQAITRMTITGKLTNEHGMNEKVRPLSIQAYLVGETDTDYLFGDTPVDISVAIRKEDLVLVEVLPPKKKDKYDKQIDDYELSEGQYPN